MRNNRHLFTGLFFAILFLSFFLGGCDKDYQGIIQPSVSGYTILDITNLQSFTRTETDSVLILYLRTNNTGAVKNITADLYNPKNERVAGFPLQLLDNGMESNGDLIANDGIFSNKIVMSRNFINGTYYLEYSVTAINSPPKIAASQSFLFNNGQSNVAPLVANLTAPDTLTVNDTTLILLTIEATDSNGLEDIERVFFRSYRPDGSTSGATFSMYDNGRDGDTTANDGIYSAIISVYPSNQKGTYRFEFQAIDRGKKLSNIITHWITLL